MTFFVYLDLQNIVIKFAGRIRRYAIYVTRPAFRPRNSFDSRSSINEPYDVGFFGTKSRISVASRDLFLENETVAN